MSILEPLRRLPRRASLIGAGALLALGAILPSTALAASGMPATCNLACVQNFGNLKIANRITDLTALAGHATNQLNAGRITAAQNQQIQNDVTTNISGLNTLKGQLDSATDEQTARNDVMLIYTQFRIYAVVLPRDYRLLHIDVAQFVDGKLRALQPTIEKWIDSTSGSEQQQLSALYSDYKAQLQEAEAQIDAAQGQLAVLTPANFNNDNAGYRSAWLAYVGDARAAHADLHNAARDLHQMAHILKSNGGGASSATPTALPTATGA